jgi:hypothetical protein
VEGHRRWRHDEWTECVCLTCTYPAHVYQCPGDICERFREGGCPEGDDCQYAHVDEGRLNLRLVVSSSLTLYLDRIDDDTESPLSSPIVTPRASDFPRGQIADRSTKQLAMATPSIPEIVHDLSPMILSGRRLLTTLGSREELPPRPFSTPPRVSSRTEATCRG